jgi:hypothetical protein
MFTKGEINNLQIYEEEANVMRFTSVEKYLEKFNTTVYPITLLKYILNRGQILRYFKKAQNPSFNKFFNTDSSNCAVCEHKRQEEGVKCRPHTTIQRMKEIDDGWLYDVDTGVFIYRNEVFKRVINTKGEDLLVITYCPHTKLISGKITDKKVRKLTPLTIKMDQEFSQFISYLEKQVENTYQEFMQNCISSDALIEEKLGCWFNDEFTIVIQPDDVDGSRDHKNQDWCLITNY